MARPDLPEPMKSLGRGETVWNDAIDASPRLTRTFFNLGGRTGESMLRWWVAGYGARALAFLRLPKLDQRRADRRDAERDFDDLVL